MPFSDAFRPPRRFLPVGCRPYRPRLHHSVRPEANTRKLPFSAETSNPIPI